MAVNKLDNSMLDAGTIGTTANKLLQLDGSTKIPAVDGSLLTGIPSAFTKSASDPVITTNPAGGVGTIWINTTSGEAYCCTDATAGANVWTNIGEGSGDIKLQFEGESYGYNSGGRIPAYDDVIQKWSFTSDANATDVANLSQARDSGVGTQSKTYSYVSAGWNPTGHLMIDKHQFATTNNATSVGNLINKGYVGAGVSSADYGYHVGGDEPVDNVIQRFSFTTDGNATDVGNLTVSRQQLSGHSDWTNDYGYAAGGYPSNNVIDRFAFGSSSNATDVGDLISAATEGPTGTSSATHGYVAGGYGQPNFGETIQKFAFASSANASDIGDLTDGRYGPAGSSSTTHGYVTGGNIATGTSFTNIIDKHSHVTDGNSTDVGDLLAARTYSMGTHV